MTPIIRIVLALGALCLSVVVGASFAHTSRTSKHYYHFLYAAKNDKPGEVVQEYHRLPREYRTIPFVKASYDEASKRVRDSEWFDFFPTSEKGDFLALGLFAIGMAVFWLCFKPKKQKLYAQEKSAAQPEYPTAGQLAFIRRINNGVIPVGLTKPKAAMMIKSYLAKVGSPTVSQRIDISPAEFMSRSQSYREKMKTERERKRAQEKLARQQERERLKKERDEARAQRAAEKYYDKKLAEEEKLLKAREDLAAGVAHRSRNPKMRKIQEFQDFVNGILADNELNPQEVRQLKAWLVANKQKPDDFSAMIGLLDEALVDGVIDAEETQAIYEGVFDCLITLRERK